VKTTKSSAAIQSAPAAGYSDWLAADEAALNYIATHSKILTGLCNETALILTSAVRTEDLDYV